MAMTPQLAAIDPRITAALIAAAVSLVVTCLTVFLTPLLKWKVERELQSRQAGYAARLERLKTGHQRSLQREEAAFERALADQQSAAELELARHKADIEYEIEQRRMLRQHTGAFRGRLLEAGSSLNFRIDNLRENRSEVRGAESSEKWLDVRGNYEREGSRGYYFVSTVYRFMAFAAIANKFERAAVYVDPRYADPADQQTVFFVRALRWALTDSKLFDGVDPPYEPQDATDHLFTDDIRRMCAVMTREDGQLKEMDEVHLEAEGVLQPVLSYFDGLTEGSLKWDRLMVFELLLKAFLNTIGYEQVSSSQEWFDETAASIRRTEIRQNVTIWLPRLAIGGEAASAIVSALTRASGDAANDPLEHDAEVGDVEPLV